MKTFYKVLSLFKLPLHKQALLVSDVPSNILSTFFNAYSQAEESLWYTRLGVFIVKFKDGDVFRQIYFRTNATMIRNYTKVSIEEIPQEIIESLGKIIPAHGILEVFKHIEDDGGSPLYRLTYIKDKQHVESEYDVTGQIIKKNQF